MLNNTAKNSVLEGKRVFLVEDDVLNLAVINRVLTNNKASVFQNYNSIGIVIHVIQHLPIDLVILDIMLRRGINGFDVVKEFKTDPRTSHIPIVAVSSLDPEIAIPQAKESGFDGFISKPINSVTFASDLAAIMNGAQRWVTSR
jgi:two-component system cell cycle response regulator